jgi:hypothetical protein
MPKEGIGPPLGNGILARTQAFISSNLSQSGTSEVDEPQWAADLDFSNGATAQS